MMPDGPAALGTRVSKCEERLNTRTHADGTLDNIMGQLRDMYEHILQLEAHRDDEILRYNQILYSHAESTRSQQRLYRKRPVSKTTKASSPFPSQSYT